MMYPMDTATGDRRPMDVQLAIQEDGQGRDDEGGQKAIKGDVEQQAAAKEAGHSACTRRLAGWFKRLRDWLREAGAKSIPKDDLAKEKTEEGRAYKKLMEVLAGEPTDHPFSVIMWIIHLILLVIFIILVTTFASIHVIHRHMLFHMRIHSWVALLMVVVSGYPFVRSLTFLISEPLVWIWKMNKYVYFFARHLKKSFDVTLWFTLILWVWYTWFRSQVVKDTRGANTLHVPVEEYKEELKVVVKQITRLLMALSIGALIWTIKSAVFLKLLADLHFTELCERIRQTILDLHGIQFIENKHWEFLTRTVASKNDPYGGGGGTQMSEEGSTKTKTIGDDELSFWMCVSRLNKKTAPIWILKRLAFTYMEHMKRKPAILRRLQDVDDDEKLMEEAKSMLKLVIRDHANQDVDITREDLGKYVLGDNTTRKMAYSDGLIRQSFRRI